MTFIKVPEKINFKDLTSNKSLSPLNYKGLIVKNKNKIKLRELILEPIVNGTEVGSDQYIQKSNKFFIRTKAVQNESFLLKEKEHVTIVPIRPQSFENQDLRQGDILILKDSNIGEVALLDKDYPNHMLSGGFRKLRFKKYSNYVFAYMKSKFFKEQLNFLIGKGATIKHAKDKYLECDVVFPNGDNAEEIINYISVLVDAVVRKEKRIRQLNDIIVKYIDLELEQNYTKAISEIKTEINKIIKTLDISLSKEEFIKEFIILAEKNSILKKYKNPSYNWIVEKVREIIQKTYKKNKKLLDIVLTQLEKEILQLYTEVNNHNIRFKTLINNNRMDAGFYEFEFRKKKKMIDDYRYGSNTVKDLGFTLERGQNLQVSAIGKSIYSEEKKKGFYQLYFPTHISEYGTIDKSIYLGNKNNLKCLSKGDLVIGAEGFHKGRSIVITEKLVKTITNIHGVVLKPTDKNIKKSIFLRCFLHYLREKGMIDRYAVGGNGGSFALKYWHFLKVPNFPQTIIEKIVKSYYIEKEISYKDIKTPEEFTKKDEKITKELGILNLDSQIKKIRKKIDELIEKIYENKEITIDYEFLDE